MIGLSVIYKSAENGLTVQRKTLRALFHYFKGRKCRKMARR